MNSLNTNNIKWSENVIIADADYIDKVAFDLIVNFERMINPASSLPTWLSGLYVLPSTVD